MLSKMTVGFGLSVAAFSIANAVLLIFKESTPSFKTWMAALTTHHWVTHSLFVVTGFLVLGCIFSKANWPKNIDGQKLSNYLIWGVILACLMIYGFYAKHL